MIAHHSLGKIRKQLNINKKTAFDWRHKILSSYEQDNVGDFKGIVEIAETFFEHSQNGKRHIERPALKRGSDLKKRGI